MARISIPKKLQFRVWTRDKWRCSYCKRGVIFSPALKELELISPGKGYYDQHGSRQRMLALFENLCACCDHILPVTKGGKNEIKNLVTACFECNRAKSDLEVFDIEPLASEHEVPENWDGLLGVYIKLSEDKTEWKRVIESA